MSLKSYAAPLLVVPQRSSWLRFYLLSLLIFLLSGLFLAPFPVWLQTVLLIGGVLLLWQHWQTYYLRIHSDSIMQGCWQEDGQWLLTLHSGEELLSELQSPVFCHRLLVILNFRADNKKTFTMLLPRDALPENVHRHLRVRIRLEVK